MQQTNFTGNLDQDGNTTMVFIIEETSNCGIIVDIFCFNIRSI